MCPLSRRPCSAEISGIEKRATFFEITPADWQRQLDVNLSGTFYCTQAAARQMAKRGYGRIVNLSSVAGIVGLTRAAASQVV